jgi:hypothetical protein
MTFSALTSALTVAGVSEMRALSASTRVTCSFQNLKTWPFSRSLVLFRMGAAMMRPTMSVVGLTGVDRQAQGKNRLMSADPRLDALDGAGNLITDMVSHWLDSLGRLLGGLATRRLQIGEQSLPAL